MFGSFELLFGGGLVHFPDCYFGVGFYFSILIQEIEELDFVRVVGGAGFELGR